MFLVSRVYFYTSFPQLYSFGYHWNLWLPIKGAEHISAITIDHTHFCLTQLSKADPQWITWFWSIHEVVYDMNDLIQAEVDLIWVSGSISHKNSIPLIHNRAFISTNKKTELSYIYFLSTLESKRERAKGLQQLHEVEA